MPACGTLTNMRWLATTLLLCSCTAGPTTDPDGDTRSFGDSHTGGDAPAGDQQAGDQHAGDQHAGGDGAPWSWCPDSSAYVGASWPYLATVTDEALFCVINNGISLPEILERRTQVRLVAGAYPLPDTVGTYTMTLPACLLRPGVSSTHDGDGSLSVTIRDYTTWYETAFEQTQPMAIGSDTWTLSLEIRVNTPTGDPMPPLLIDDRIRHDDLPGTSGWYSLEGPGWPYRAPLFPCQSYDPAGRQQGVTFDRGHLNVQDHFIPDVFGAGNTAAQLTRAWGDLDGVSFDQEDFFHLAHRPDHHNSGGGFLVVFDAPINEACGLEVHIPSFDGGWANLEGWTLDCGLNRLNDLTGMARQ